MVTLWTCQERLVERTSCLVTFVVYPSDAVPSQCIHPVHTEFTTQVPFLLYISFTEIFPFENHLHFETSQPHTTKPTLQALLLNESTHLNHTKDAYRHTIYTPFTIKMCQIDITVFACCHQRKTISEPCSLEEISQMIEEYSSPHTSAACCGDCPNGFTIAATNNLSTACGQDDPNFPFSCSELVILAPFFAHHENIKAEFTDYEDRIDLVADSLTVMRDSGGIECEWSQVPSAELQDMKDEYDIHWNTALPSYLATAQATIMITAEHLQFAHTHTVDVLLGCLVVKYPSGLDVEIDLEDVGSNESEGMAMYRQVVDRVRYQVREALEMLEELAVRACLDRVGWSLPVQDLEATDTLLSWVLERQVKPVYGAIKAEESLGPRVEREVDMDVQMEDVVDPLDTAEMDEGWGCPSLSSSCTL
jgi:hypothetical protein